MKRIALFPALLLIAMSASLGAIAVHAAETAAFEPSLQTSAVPATPPNASPTTVTNPPPAPAVEETPAPAAPEAVAEVTVAAISEPVEATPAPNLAAVAATPVAQLPAAITLAPNYDSDAAKSANLLARMNEARANASLNALEADLELEAVALVRARDLIANGYFDHYSPAGENAFSELGARGIPYRLAGENLARNNYPEVRTMAAAFDGLMGSPGHRANVLEPRFARAGVAVVRGGKVWYYVTVFAD